MPRTIRSRKHAASFDAVMLQSVSSNGDDFDALVLGAGAAGLAAASLLSAHGLCVCVLEARDRVGGRILTRRVPGTPVPLELGAEFIHGTPRSTFHWLARADIAAVDVGGARFALDRDELRPADDTFAELKHALARVSLPADDLSFDAFLEGPARGKLAPRAAAFARSLLEGFDAADPARASALDTVAEWSGDAAADARTFRPIGGYGALVDALFASLDPERVDVRLGAAARAVRWQRGRVRVDVRHGGRDLSLAARRAVVTLPLGVLAGAQVDDGGDEHVPVRFEPDLTAKRDALGGLAAGAVVKVLLAFGSPFWETLDGGRYRDAAFFHAPKAAFRTIWTTLPTRSAVLTAWLGGPRAASLARRGRDDVVAAALDALGSVFGERAVGEAGLEGAWFHDWQSDPFARGAYSYVTVGGRGAQSKLAEPLSGTLFFAGEATDASGGSATVAGALASGERAAREILDEAC